MLRSTGWRSRIQIPGLLANSVLKMTREVELENEAVHPTLYYQILKTSEFIHDVPFESERIVQSQVFDIAPISAKGTRGRQSNRFLARVASDPCNKSRRKQLVKRISVVQSGFSKIKSHVKKWGEHGVPFLRDSGIATSVEVR